MSNFHFLKDDWPEFIDDANALEKLVRFDPRSACGRAHHLIERVVLWMYDFMIRRLILLTRMVSMVWSKEDQIL